MTETLQQELAGLEYTSWLREHLLIWGKNKPSWSGVNKTKPFETQMKGYLPLRKDV